MRRLKLSDIKKFIQGHPAGEWQSQDLIPGSLALNIQTAPPHIKDIISTKATEMSPALTWLSYPSQMLVSRWFRQARFMQWPC